MHCSTKAGGLNGSLRVRGWSTPKGCSRRPVAPRCEAAARPGLPTDSRTRPRKFSVVVSPDAIFSADARSPTVGSRIGARSPTLRPRYGLWPCLEDRLYSRKTELVHARRAAHEYSPLNRCQPSLVKYVYNSPSTCLSKHLDTVWTRERLHALRNKNSACHRISL